MPRTPRSWWLSWAALFATLALWPALPRLVAPPREPWNAAETAVAGFVLALLALAAGIGTLALREALVQRDLDEGRLDPTTPAGRTAVHVRLVSLWLLCAAIGACGGILLHYSVLSAAGWPYLAGAAALFLVHAPSARFFRRVCEGAASGARESR
ncbi:MAG TPA: hypothetical protein VLC53_19825 [Myxococcota bacterium]|nr:hypothetical protein [Myxococcota bacterium]